MTLATENSANKNRTGGTFMKNLTTVIAMAVLAGCATTTNKSVEVPVANGPVERDYIVRERNPDPAPDWTANFAKWKQTNSGHGTSYFLGDSGDVNDRISGCDMAALTAKKKIAQQVAELITNKIASDKQGRLAIDPSDSQDPGLKRAFEEQIAGKSVAFLSGVKEHGSFWEQRDYSKSGGHKRVFNCSVVVGISDKDFEAALLKSSQKTPDIIEDADAKAAVKDALKDVDSEFKKYQSAIK